ncbi:hypothetical protein LUZ60_017240 [Juncus effusus]|nr:hypothetical protein LUZ60_017240 [Juncus effusus]
MEEGKPSVELVKASNGLEKYVLREIRGSSVEVYLYGGQVISWKNLSEELLFVSSKAVYKPPRPIRGGIQICFSQAGGGEQHGSARTQSWTFDKDPPPFPTNSPSKTFVDLILTPSEDSLKACCEVRLRVALSPGGDLILTSRVRNTSKDGKSFSFQFAYQTYFRVSDISEVRVEGLETLDYLDNLRGKERFTEQGDAIVFESEVDKIYVDAPPKIAIIDHEKKHTFVLSKNGLPDVVVWNPWEKKSKQISDLGDEEYKHMLCVGAAALERPVTLKPGEEWTGRQEMSAVPSSYCSGQLDPRKVLEASGSCAAG